MNDLYDVVVLGAGPAGLSAAIYLARAQYRVVVVEKDTFGGQITITSDVVNYPGVFSASGESLTTDMQRQAENFGAEFLKGEAIDLDMESDIKKVKLKDGRELSCLGLVLAMGASPRLAGFKGEMDFRGRGVAYCATCDGEFFTDKDILVVGGGFAAAEEAMFLTKYGKSVTILVREEKFSCAQSVVDKLQENDKIKIFYNTEITEVGGENALQYALMRNNKTGEETRYECGEDDTFGLFVFAGYSPATELVKGKINLDHAGYIDCDKGQRTNINGVYGAGDICTKNLRQVVTAVSDGAVAATELEKYVSGRYDDLNLPPREPVRKAAPQAQAQAHSSKPGVDDSSFLSEDLKNQLFGVFSKLERDITLHAILDDGSLSQEIEGFLQEFSQLSPHIKYALDKAGSSEGIVPEIRMETDSSYSGISFHAVPGGHEMNSFVIAIYNLAGPGQPIADEMRERIEALTGPINITILATLSCTMCPALVMASQRIASLNGNVQAHMVDLNHFPDLKSKYNVMSVPAMILYDATEPIFGKKDLVELLEILEKL